MASSSSLSASCSAAMTLGLPFMILPIVLWSSGRPRPPTRRRTRCPSPPESPYCKLFCPQAKRGVSAHSWSLKELVRPLDRRPRSPIMKHRIVMWAEAGLLVACGWALFAFAMGPVAISSMPFLWILAQLTCPIVLAGTYFHFGVHLYWVIATNAAIYAVVGL